MKCRSLIISLTLLLFSGAFCFAGLARAQTGGAPTSALDQMITGGKQMMSANKAMSAKMEKMMGKKDPELQKCQTMMSTGYDMMDKAKPMMATNKVEAQRMAAKGAKMMLDAQNLASVECNKKGMAKDCGMEMTECSAAANKVKEGALQWFFGGTGM